MHISFIISPVVIALLATGFVALAAVVWWHWTRALRLRRFASRYEHGREYATQLPPVSVVVSAHNDADCLQRFLPSLLEQDYPADFEVVVVDDGSCDTSADALSALVAQYGNLRVTFIPDDTRALSRKKLSIMVGIKAAKHDIVLTTCANCRPDSPQWLRLMMRNFTPDTDVVLGFSHIEAGADRGIGRRYRAFDAASCGCQWLSAAVKGNPYRGDGNNLAYRKRCFFERNGFASSLDLRWGEDDVFVSEIATGANTRVEIDPDAMVTVEHDDAVLAHRRLKLRRDFTARRLPRLPFAVQGLMSVLAYAGVACTAAAVALDWANVVTDAVAAVVVLAAAVAVMPAVGRCCRLLGLRRLRLTVPVMVLWRPLVDIAYMLRATRDHDSNYTSIID